MNVITIKLIPNTKLLKAGFATIDVENYVQKLVTFLSLQLCIYLRNQWLGALTPARHAPASPMKDVYSVT